MLSTSTVQLDISLTVTLYTFHFYQPLSSILVCFQHQQFLKCKLLSVAQPLLTTPVTCYISQRLF